MLIPGILISLITFPGVIVHELAHQIFCRLMKIPVYKVKYFRIKNPCGYVLHEATEKAYKALLISIGPFLVNTILGIIILLPVSIQLFVFGSDSLSLLNLILVWLGISILMHAFPSKGDAQAIKRVVYNNSNTHIITKILVLPVIGLIYIGSFGSIVWLDLIYAVAVTKFLPNILVTIIY